MKVSDDKVTHHSYQKLASELNGEVRFTCPQGVHKLSHEWCCTKVAYGARHKAAHVGERALAVVAREALTVRPEALELVAIVALAHVGREGRRGMPSEHLWQRE